MLYYKEYLYFNISQENRMRKKFVFYLLIFLSFLSFSENEEYYDKISEDFDVALNQLRELEPTHKIIF